MSFMGKMIHLYSAQLASKPLRTNVITAGLLALGSDIICQAVLEQKKHLDLRRTLAITAFGAFYNGGICTLVYPLYFKVLPMALRQTSLRRGLGTTLLDNGIHTPMFYIPTFFLSTGMLQGDSLAKSVETMKAGYLEAIKYTWAMWIPFQYLNFSVVPPKLRVLFLSSGCFFYTCGLDYFSQRLSEDK